ncbi:MAG: IS91 family transposase [Gemmatimonadota bacterium]|nr:IS91 family transposase [Gemmatimonadota bacterium]
MPSVAEVVRRYGPEYLERFGDRMPAAHRKVLRDIAGCRTGALGTALYRCEDCGRIHAVGRSCGDRHCPSCQRDKAEAWLAKQVDRLLPCPYFLVTFTLPAELRDVARAHQRAVYGALFAASSAALRAVMAEPKFLGADRPGFFGVLHTWGRALEYHPHVHYVVPGGGISAEGDRWVSSRPGFLVPVRALSVVFRAKFRDALRDEGLLDRVDPSVWRRDWVVHCEPTGDGQRSLRYLAPYVFRVAIGDHRIVSCDDGRVTFTYRKVGSNRRRTMTLDAMEFLRRFLQHVLPSGFAKVRYYGFLSPAAGVALELVRRLIAAWSGGPSEPEPARVGSASSAPSDGPRCPSCGGRLVLLGFEPAAGVPVFDTS